MKRTNYYDKNKINKRQNEHHLMSQINQKMGQRVPGMNYYTSAQTQSQIAKNTQNDYHYYSHSSSSSRPRYTQSSYPSQPIDDLNDPNNPNSPDNPRNPNNYQYITRKHRHHKWELIIGTLTCLATMAGVGVTWLNNNNKPANHTEKVYPTRQTKTSSEPSTKPKTKVKVKKIYEKPRVEKIIKKTPTKSASSVAPSSSSSANQTSSVISSAPTSSLKSRAANVGDKVKDKALQFGHRLQGYEQKPSSNEPSSN